MNFRYFQRTFKRQKKEQKEKSKISVAKRYFHIYLWHVNIVFSICWYSLALQPQSYRIDLFDWKISHSQLQNPDIHLPQVSKEIMFPEVLWVLGVDLNFQRKIGVIECYKFSILKDTVHIHIKTHSNAHTDTHNTRKAILFLPLPPS